MKIAVLSDIHGNYTALEAVLKEIHGNAVDEIVIAGDHFNDASQPMEVYHALLPLKAWIIKGNKEQRVLNYRKGKCPDFTEYLQMASFMWTYKQFNEEVFSFMEGLPEQIVIELPNTEPIRVVHGSPLRIDEMLYPDKNEKEIMLSLQNVEEKVLICGHTHVQWHRRIGDKLILNPGSVGVSYNKGGLAEYSMLQWEKDHWEVSEHLVEYDKDLLEQVFHRSGYLEAGGAFAKAVLYSIKAGKDEFVDFVQSAYRLAEERGRKALLIPNDIWREVEENWDWKE